MARASFFSGNKVTEADVRSAETPPETRTHVPMPHGEFLDNVLSVLRGQQWEVTSQQFGLDKGKLDDVVYPMARLFGVLKVQKEDVVTGDEYQLAIGIRNAHDKRVTAGMVGGLSVMVCDNLDFFGDFGTSHKHTVNIRHELPARLWQVVCKLTEAHSNHREAIDSYKAREISDTESHDLIVQCADRGVYPWQFGEKVLSEYRKPRHEAFEERTVWAFNNAVTETLKARRVSELPTSMSRFHALAKDVCMN